ncbi:hypothetical protein DN730_11385 [Marinomonas piezotolerans]|uniref:Sulfotransferase domain-containing protein n=1 Tax=Marinomonas piezotolerans TaxID=2213058 RepID=A0A370U911_9GAMM|nr:sulfotransferase domain-containing protein [Marinomonas piezotolerans]RDL44223.1 hypothetical protein DN730_11385 [Marinomonas piezotolerans]
MLNQPIVLSGQPRSGYALTNNIIHKIKLCARRLNDDSQRQKAQAITRDPSLHLVDVYHSALQSSGYDLNHVIINGEFHSLFGGPKWFDEDGHYYVRKYIGVVGKGDLLINHRIPSLIAHYYDTLHSHEYPQVMLSLAPDARHVASIRNPLDMMNSANHSINALSSEYIQRNPSLGQETTIREQIALSKFSDLRLCDGLIQHQKRYWLEFLPVQDQFYQVIWEDLIQFPLETIQKLCEALHISLNQTQIRAIWHSMDHKNTLLYHLHNFRENKGIVGDWQNNLVNEHIDLFKAAGFDEILVALGYPQLTYFRESEYNDRQKAITANLRTGATPSISDDTLATFAFNKSNIDTSQYDFYKGQWQGNTCIERATFTDSALFEQLISQSEGRIALAYEKCKQTDTWQTDFPQEFIVNLKSAIQSGKPVALWGISYDFERLIDQLPLDILNAPNVTLFDQLEAGLMIGSKPVESSNKLPQFDGQIFAVPTQPGAKASMLRLAKHQHFDHRLTLN